MGGRWGKTIEGTRSRPECLQGDLGVAGGRSQAAMAEQELYGPDVGAAFQQMRGKAVAVRIRILPMKCPQSQFIIVTILFMGNTGRSFAGYGGTRAIKWSSSSAMKYRRRSRAGC